MSDRHVGADFERCFAAALDEAFAPAALPTGLLAGSGGMVSAALGIGDALPWLRQPMSSAASAPFPGVADRAPRVNAYHKDYKAKRRRISKLAMETTVDQLRALATGKWLAVLEVNLPASQVGKHIVRVQERDDALVAVQDVLEDVFAAKANNTLNARSTAALLYKSGMQPMWR